MICASWIWFQDIADDLRFLAWSAKNKFGEGFGRERNDHGDTSLQGVHPQCMSFSEELRGRFAVHWYFRNVIRLNASPEVLGFEFRQSYHSFHPSSANIGFAFNSFVSS